METKLTLKLDLRVIEKAKEYAKQHKTSLSGIVENYLQKITDKNDDEQQITPLVKSLSGIINLTEDYDHKKDYSDFLVNKYR